MTKRLRHPHRGRGQRGAALLMAMLTVTLVATFAAASLWQQWRSVEVETAERSRVQSSWVLTGALDWARLILREDVRAGSGNVDHLGEPWAVPLQESRLSTFLAADRDHVGDANDDVDAFLSGQIIDMQSRLNITNLIDGVKVSEPAVSAFSRLFTQLNLPAQELALMTENLRLAAVAIAASAGTTNTGTTTGAATGTASADTGNSASAAPLVPQRVDQLGWLGLSPATVQALQPFVTVLKSRTSINLNTASVEVLQAAVAGGLNRSDAQRLVTARARNPFRALADAQALLGSNNALPLVDSDFGVNSQFFEVQGRLRIGAMLVIERSLVQRSSGVAGPTVVTLWRTRTAADAPALVNAVAAR